MDQHPDTGGAVATDRWQARLEWAAQEPADEGSGADDRPGRRGPHRQEREAQAGATDGLSERERSILAFERQWWKVPGSKERAVREAFDLSATRYYQLLNSLIERDEVVRHDPMLVKRLRRARADRVRGRTARRLGLGPL